LPNFLIILRLKHHSTAGGSFIAGLIKQLKIRALGGGIKKARLLRQANLCLSLEIVRLRPSVLRTVRIPRYSPPVFQLFISLASNYTFFASIQIKTSNHNNQSSVGQI
jgi:hypothetical protein